MADVTTPPPTADEAKQTAADTTAVMSKDATPEAIEAPSTPKKTAAKAKKPATPKTPKEPKAPKTPKSTAAKRAADGDETPSSGKKARKAAATPTGRTGIPTSLAEMGEEDKMLMTWKKEGRSWGDINKEWERITGNKPASSTLPNRFNRLKANISTVEDCDIDQMKLSVVAVEVAIETEYKEAIAKKWARIAKHMKENGVENEYQPSLLEKHWKKLKATPSVSPPPVVDSGVESGAEVESKVEADAAA